MRQEPFKGEGETVDVVDDSIVPPSREEIEGRVYQDKDWLYHQYHGLKKSIQKIADSCEASSTTIERWLDKHGIETRSLSEATSFGKSDGNPVWRNKDWLERQYIELQKSIIEIAEIAGCTPSTVNNWLNNHNIEVRSASDSWALRREKQSREYHDKKWLKNQYIGLGKSSVEIGHECGVHHMTILTWLKKHDIPVRDESEALMIKHRKEISVSDGDETPQRKPITRSAGKTRYEGPETGLDLTPPESPTTLESPWRDREWLRNQYWGEMKTGHEIAQICEVSPSTIYDWLRRHGIETREDVPLNNVERPYQDAEWLERKYWGEMKTQKEIGEICDVSQGTIGRWLARNGIEKRDALEPLDSPDPCPHCGRSFEESNHGARAIHVDRCSP